MTDEHKTATYMTKVSRRGKKDNASTVIGVGKSVREYLNLRYADNVEVTIRKL